MKAAHYKISDHLVVETILWWNFFVLFFCFSPPPLLQKKSPPPPLAISECVSEIAMLSPQSCGVRALPPVLIVRHGKNEDYKN